MEHVVWLICCSVSFECCKYDTCVYFNFLAEYHFIVLFVVCCWYFDN